MSLLPKRGGDEQNRTVDPLLARQVLSQLSYTPTECVCILLCGFSSLPQTFIRFSGLKWTRTIDLTLIRRAL